MNTASPIVVFLEPTENLTAFENNTRTPAASTAIGAIAAKATIAIPRVAIPLERTFIEDTAFPTSRDPNFCVIESTILMNAFFPTLIVFSAAPNVVKVFCKSLMPPARIPIEDASLGVILLLAIAPTTSSIMVDIVLALESSTLDSDITLRSDDIVEGMNLSANVSLGVTSLLDIALSISEKIVDMSFTLVLDVSIFETSCIRSLMVFMILLNDFLNLSTCLSVS